MDILESVNAKAEHRDFLTFHNGLTIVAKEVKVYGNKLYLSRYSVCNGCQSLLTFYENRALLTDDLEVLVRVVRVSEDLKISERIAYRTNNQNSISLRDLRSNDSTQIQLKAEFDKLYGKFATYGIKSGDTTLTMLD